MKLKLSILIPFFISIIKAVDYDQMTILELIDSAEIIGKCEIVKVENETFTVEFSDVIKGNPTKQMKIIKFRNWTCASRWNEYKIGQTELIFLAKNKKGWQALGAGNEGEIAIQDDELYYSQYLDIDKKQERFNIGDKIIHGLAFKYLNVKKGISEYLENKSHFKSMDEKQVKNFKSENLFLEAIVKCLPHSYDE